MLQSALEPNPFPAGVWPALKADSIGSRTEVSRALCDLKENGDSSMKRTLSAVLLACLVAGMFALSTFADGLSFLAPIAGSNPGITIAGVASGGLPWVVKHGFATLNDDGRLSVDVRGLILPAFGNAGPITAVAASVVCSNTVAATSAAVPLSNDGNAEIHAKLQLPSPCFGTIILVRIAGVNGTMLPAAGPWIAASSVSKDSDDN
jgi:hypothetical protein